MLLSQQAHLHRLDGRRAVVRVAGNWIAMVQSRLPLLERAMATTLGSPRQVTLEASDQREPTPAPPPQPLPVQPLPVPAPVVEPLAVQPPVVTTPVMPPPVVQPPALEPSPAGETPPAVKATAPPPPEPNGQPIAGPGPAETAASPRGNGQPQTGSGGSRLEQKTQLFADFFNGEVITLDTED
jgi:DNA polymerase-3 subunit gamma/tau